MAAGKPVVAIRAGGPRDTVVDGVTGVFFDRQDAVISSKRSRLDDLTFDPVVIRAHAESFDTSVFRRRWRELFARLGVDPSLNSAG